MDTILFGFCSEGPFWLFRSKIWTHWAVFNKYSIPEHYLMDPVSCDLFRRSVLSTLEQNIGLIWPCSINTSWQGTIWWNRCHATFFFEGLFWIFRGELKKIIHGRFIIQWIVFENSLNIFELVWIFS